MMGIVCVGGYFTSPSVSSLYDIEWYNDAPASVWKSLGKPTGV
jgi:hypothetical protein